MQSDDGRLIPLVVAIGNHDVDRDFGFHNAHYFQFLFEQSDLSYFTRHFGNHTVLHVLDSGHIVPFSGDQSDWLAKTLDDNRGIRNKLALYHVPLYPSLGDFNTPDAERARKAWAPLFDRFGLDLAFENHNHTLKRTKKLFAETLSQSEKGTIYLGGGCFGMPAREADPNRWYLEKTVSVRHFWSVTVSPNGYNARAYDISGKIIDEVGLLFVS
jgi:hypothetical protein